mgnify:CR=1 FL=1
MKSIFTFIIAAFLLFPLQAQEKVYTVDNLPKVHLQNKMQYVCNPAGILSQAACDSIDAMLYALEQQTGIETVVAVVPSIGETDCFDFCHQLLNKWGVGKKDKNNGLVNFISYRPTLYSILYRLRLGRCASGCNLQKDSNEIYDSLSERWELGRRNGGRFESNLSTARRFYGE